MKGRQSAMRKLVTSLFVAAPGQLFSYKTNAVDNNITTNGAFTNFIVPE
jgi:hypothetical protein